MAKKSELFSAAVIVAALGYFVDIYDLVLFSIVRVKSLNELGLQGTDVFDTGVFLLNMQMGGMLLGGILWGILGDKRGRLSVLFGSIVVYSVANLLNSFVDSVNGYAVLRFLAGLGLAGELGAGVTLVSEVLSKEMRGYGTMMVATVGVSGAILAGLVGEHLPWRIAYFIGGILGLCLLLLRVRVFESNMFSKIKTAKVKRGDLLSLLTSPRLLKRYCFCILSGVPIWFVIGVLVTFSPEFAQALNYSEPVSAGKAIMYTYIGLVFGDFFSGVLSQVWKSRKKALLVFLVMTLMGVVMYFSLKGLSEKEFYLLCVFLGFGIGYWAVFVTVAAEQFGTNLRSTVATTTPNFVRGSVVVLTFLVSYFKPSLGILGSGLLVGLGTIVVAFFAVFQMDETFSKDLDYLEELA